MASRGITFLGLRAIRKSSKHLASVYFLHFHHCIFPLRNDLNLRSTVFVTEVPKSLRSMRICMILATWRKLVLTPDLTTRIIVMDVWYFCTKNVVRKVPEERVLALRFLSEWFDVKSHFRNFWCSFQKNPRHTTDQGVEVVVKELQYVQVCSQEPWNQSIWIYS